MKKTVFVISNKDRADSDTFVDHVRRTLDPANNDLCLTFFNRIENSQFGDFDAKLKKKKPDILLFSGVPIHQIRTLSKRAKGLRPDLAFISDTPAVIDELTIQFIKTIDESLLEVLHTVEPLKEKEAAA